MTEPDEIKSNHPVKSEKSPIMSKKKVSRQQSTATRYSQKSPAQQQRPETDMSQYSRSGKRTRLASVDVPQNIERAQTSQPVVLDQAQMHESIGDKTSLADLR
jgi:hypothetical protein